jgi:hypothetical protein
VIIKSYQTIKSMSIMSIEMRVIIVINKVVIMGHECVNPKN